jgi:hypothetical protein
MFNYYTEKDSNKSEETLSQAFFEMYDSVERGLKEAHTAYLTQPTTNWRPGIFSNTPVKRQDSNFKLKI